MVLLAAGLVVARNLQAHDDSSAFLNVSYDPTRELYRDIDRQFATAYRQRTGKEPTIRQSHGGSSRQSQAVADGLAADVVTLAMYSDVDALRKRGLIAADWVKRLPNDSLAYTSTIVFLVRKGNPAHVGDWPDLVRPGVALVTPNPRTSGNGRLSFLAAWGSVLRSGGDENAARAYVTHLYEHVTSLDDSARGATRTFADERVGDVLLTWENEALREADESKGEMEIVYPSSSIRAEPYVAWVDSNVQRKGTLELAKAYLSFLFTDEAQETIARSGYRPVTAAVLARHRDRFPAMDLFPVTFVAKDWADAQDRFFAEDGTFAAISRGARNDDRAL